MIGFIRFHQIKLFYKKIFKTIIITLFLCNISDIVYSAPPSRIASYISGTTISSVDVTANEDAIFSYLQGGLDSFLDGSIVNADINASANIQSDKLNLLSISQAFGINSSGSLTNAGTTSLTGTFSATGTTNTIGNGGSDTLTLNVPGGLTLSAATTWTLTGALTFSGTIANLGTVTTANIDGGTMDGVQVGGTTATGEIIVNDSSDDADGLGSQGSSGQFLKSAGTGANPTFGNLPISSENAISCYSNQPADTSYFTLSLNSACTATTLPSDRVSMAILSIVTDGATNLQIRTTGNASAIGWGSIFAAANTGGAMVITDASGDIDIKSSAGVSVTLTVYLMGYISVY